MRAGLFAALIAAVASNKLRAKYSNVFVWNDDDEFILQYERG